MSYDPENSLLARIAWMYYVQGLTQEEIGQKLEYSRTKVTRLLARAKEKGIVEVHINPAYRSCLDDEERLRAAFPEVVPIVVPSGETSDVSRIGVGQACAEYLQEHLSDGDVLGCAWGRSLYHVGCSLQPQRYERLTVVQLMGGMNPGTQINPQGILELIATRLHATGVWLNTPAVVGSAEIRRALYSDEGIQRVTAQWRACTKALLGIGDTTEDASLLANYALTSEDMSELRRLGAVGDINARFYDINGEPVRHEIDDRVISLPLTELKVIPVRIAVTAGIEKAQAILGGIRGGYLSVLVTDERTAQEVLRLSEVAAPAAVTSGS